MDLPSINPTLILDRIHAAPREGLSLDELIPIVEENGYRVIEVDRENNRLELEIVRVN